MKCLDTETGNMMFMWEMEMLDEEKALKFEKHHFECDGCSDEVYKGIYNAQLLRTYRESALDERSC